MSARTLLSALILAPVLCVLAPHTPAHAEDPALPDLSGTWAQLQVTTSLSEIPIVGDVIGTTKSLLIVRVTQDGGKLAIKEEICDVLLTSTAKRVETIIPRAFQKAVSGTTRKATIWYEDGALQFQEKPKTVVSGAKLARINDALPEDEDDSRLVDADKDGHPGLTVLVRGIIDGEIYVVQRGWNKLRGTVEGDMVTGKVTWKSDQSVVDASRMLLNSNTTSKPHGGASKNYFKMKRIDESTSCSSLRKSYVKLLGE